MIPTNDHEEQIKWRVDVKAHAIAAGIGSWDTLEQEMKIAVPFEMSSSEESFFQNYVAWLKAHPEEISKLLTEHP